MRMARALGLARDLDGLPLVGRREARWSLALTALATLWFGLAASWEIASPILAGHWAVFGSRGIIADNMLRWGIIGPVWEYTSSVPSPRLYYCHHPWGVFWTTAVVMKLVGRHEVACRLAPVLLSLATPPLLYLLGRALWRPAAGAVAALAFAVLPITLSFAWFNGFEVPVTTWTLVGCWGHVRHLGCGRRRYLFASLAGFTLALNADWPANVLVGVLLLFGLAFAILWPRPFGRLAAGPYMRWWAMLTTLTAATLVLYLVLFQRAGKLGDLLDSYAFRARGAGQPLGSVLASRRYWIELCFTPPAILIGKVAAALCALRLVLVRRREEIVPLAYLAMAVVNYLGFKQAADVHVYWPHYFGAFFALGAGAITASALSLGRSLAPHRPRAAAALAAGVLGCLLAVLLGVLRDGVEVLHWARASGGRFNEKGNLIHSDGRKTAFLGWLAGQLPAGATVALHPSMKATWGQVWALGGRVVQPDRKVSTGEGGAEAYLLDARFTDDATLAGVAKSFAVTAAGPFWRLSRSGSVGRFEGYLFERQEPGWLRWYFVSGTEPAWTLRPSALYGWELALHFGEPGPPPAEAPRSFEERRIAHNVAVAKGDGARAATLRAALLGELGAPRARLDDGTELLGVGYRGGARPMLTLLFQAAGPLGDDVQPAVRSIVVAPPAWSTTMADPTVREVGLPLAISPRRWHRGFIYADEVPIVKRPGRERFELALRARAGSRGRPPPRFEGGRRWLTVLVLGGDAGAR